MPTSLTVRFPAGRYHATPWGHHVNEGLVEWPPSPWRLLRALISVGHSALGWDDGAPPVARRLIESLAGFAPRYRLPPAALGHSRHYMPIGTWADGGIEKTTLVFDTFARPAGGALCVTWPVDLDADSLALLERLASRMNHLGRAESWVEAVVGDDTAAAASGTSEAWPCADGAPPLGRRWERVALLAPSTPAAYLQWRRHFLAAPAVTPATKGKAAADPLPCDIWGCLTATTHDLQAAGWSQPPGSERIAYWRDADALQLAPPTQPRRGPAQPVEAVLLALRHENGNRHALPRVERTVPQAEFLHQSFAAHLGRGRKAAHGHELVGIGPDDEPLRDHRHAHVLPLDLDEDGHLDHALVWAPGGLGREAVQAVGRVRETWQKGGGEAPIGVALAAAGHLEDLVRMPPPWGPSLGRLLGPSRRWRSLTPLVLPRFLKKSGKNSLAGQLAAELSCRGLPALVDGATAGVPAPHFRHFVLSRTHGGVPPPVCCGFDVDIELAAPVAGPLCLGYGSHFGLGLFVAC